MAEKKTSEMSLEELKTKENSLKKTIPFFTVIIVLMTAIGVFLTINQGFGVFTVLPITFIAILITFITNLKNIRKEISERSV